MRTCRGTGVSKAQCPLLTLNCNGWTFCPLCGCSAGEVTLVNDPKGQGEVSLVSRDGDTALLEVQTTGTGGEVKASFKPAGSENEFAVDWKSAPPSAEVSFGSADVLIGEFVSADGPRDPKNIFAAPLVRSRTVRLRKLSGQVKISASAELLLFLPGSRERAVTLYNNGLLPIAIGAPAVSGDFELSSIDKAVGFQLPAGGKVDLVFKAKGIPGTGAVELRLADGTLVKKLFLCLPPGAKSSRKPGLLIAIDFGTSNTSSFVIQPTIEGAEPTAIRLKSPDGREGSDRWPTEIYAPSTNRSAWKALSGLEGISDSDKILNLKTLLRREEEAPLPGGADADDVLEFYFSRLLSELIEPHLLGIDPDGRLTREFVLTVPVLDKSDDPEKGHLYRNYVERILAAAKRAGMEDESRGWRVSTMLEPDGGALEVLRGNATNRQFKDGDKLLVLDCGGGTTDITLATIGIDSGILYFRDQMNGSAVVGKNQFGGTLVTFRMGMSWVFPDLNYPGPHRGNSPTNEEHEVRKKALKSVIDALVTGSYARSTGNDLGNWTEFNETTGEPSQADNKCWLNRFPRLAGEVEVAKRLFANAIAYQHPVLKATTKSTRSSVQGEEADLTAEVKFVGSNTGFRGGDFTWEPRLLRVHYDWAVNKPVDELFAGVLQFLKATGVTVAQIQHVAIIGGSSRLSRFREKVHELFSAGSRERLVTFGDYVDVAVCRGAARKYDVSVRTLPVGLSLTDTVTAADLRQESDVFLIVDLGLAVRAKIVKEVSRQLEIGETMEVLMQATLPAREAVPLKAMLPGKSASASVETVDVKRFQFGPYEVPTTILAEAVVTQAKAEITFKVDGVSPSDPAIKGFTLEF